jgi:ABC-type uncharacterized transport system permease subunit
MRQLRQWSAAVLVGLVATTAADVLLDALGHGPMMAGGLAVGAGVAAAALTGQWLERRHRARELLAKFNEVDPG